MKPLEKPSRIRHAVCAYWVRSSAGSSANALTEQMDSMHTTASRAKCLWAIECGEIRAFVRCLSGRKRTHAIRNCQRILRRLQVPPITIDRSNNWTGPNSIESVRGPCAEQSIVHAPVEDELRTSIGLAPLRCGTWALALAAGYAARKSR